MHLIKHLSLELITYCNFNKIIIHNMPLITSCNFLFSTYTDMFYLVCYEILQSFVNTVSHCTHQVVLLI